MEYFVICKECDNTFFTSEIKDNIFICPHCHKNFFKEEASYVKKEFTDYTVEGLLGKGGMGDVYLAVQKSTGRRVALKILKPELISNHAYLERFFHEVRTLAKIEHPNVVQAIQAGMEDDTCYFSMMYIQGKDLKTRLEEGEIFSEYAAVSIVLAVAKALKFVWDKYKLLHRDIKPANIIVTSDGEIKLLDLGISKRISEDTHLTKPGMMVGSPHYVSPEQARGRKDLDFRSDMYSLGATLFHLVTGKTPFQGDNSMAVIAAHLKDAVPNPKNLNPNISDKLANLIIKLMAKDKEERLNSWDELISLLEDILAVFESQAEGEEAGDANKNIAAKQKSSSFLQLFSQRHTEKLKKIFAVEFTLYRIIALLIMLIASFMALYAVVKRSLEESKHSKATKLYNSAITKLSEKKDKKTLREVILLLESVQRTKDREYAPLAKQKIDSIVQRIVYSIKQKNRKRIQKEWKRIQEKVAGYEAANNRKKAIEYLKYYLKNGEYAKQLHKQIEDYLNSFE